MATKYKPFLFERRFDVDEPARGEDSAAAAEAESVAEPEADTPAEPEPEPATYTEEEVEAVRRAAFEDGRREGLEAGRAEAAADTEAQIADALDALVQGLAPLVERQRETAERHAAMTARIVRDIVARLMPVYVRRYGEDEITGLVAECLANLRTVDRLTVRVGEEAAEGLKTRLESASRAAGFEGRLSVVPDPALARGDVTLDWTTGGAERRYADIWADIEAAVDRATQGFDLDTATEDAGAAVDSSADPGALADPSSQAADAEPADGAAADGASADDASADDAPAEDAPADSASQDGDQAEEER